MCTVEAERSECEIQESTNLGKINIFISLKQGGALGGGGRGWLYERESGREIGESVEERECEEGERGWLCLQCFPFHYLPKPLCPAQATSLR